MDDEAIAAVSRLVKQHVGAAEPVGMLLAFLSKIGRHTLATMLNGLVSHVHLASHRERSAPELSVQADPKPVQSNDR